MKEFEDYRFYFTYDNNVLYCKFKLSHYTKESIDFGVKKRIELTENKTHYMLSDVSLLKGGMKDARDRMAEKDAFKNLHGVAIVTNKAIQKTLINLFTIFYKSTIPQKTFSNKEDALNWINNHKTLTNGHS